MKANLSNITNQADLADIKELETRILHYYSGKEDEDKFKHFRLTRGVYGQRQVGVQMFRLKIPYGKITTAQIDGVADLSDQYGSSNLHLTTRQNIQMHYVKLADSPNVWAGLSELGLTAREACGNTVRNITASPTAGIDKGELFDVSPYAQAVFEYFLRNVICQEMGRKIKPAFSGTEQDTGYTYFSDFGFIAREKDGQRGFKLVVGGGLGAQSIEAFTVSEFIETDKIIPFMEAALRVFDRYGEREKRHKARMKFLVKSLGQEKFMELVGAESDSILHKSVPIPVTDSFPEFPTTIYSESNPVNDRDFDLWYATNTFEQKQSGHFAAYIKVTNGDIPSVDARKLTQVIRKYAADDVRITIDQNLLLRFILKENLRPLFEDLKKLGYADHGQGTIGDITACPGTDTCNLGVTNSTALARELENLIKTSYPHLLTTKDIDIKISGCMNACGQHMASGIGFHGSSIKRGEYVIPAMQVVLGGGLDKNGTGYMGEKIIKLPSKRIPQGVSLILEDYAGNRKEHESFLSYFHATDKKYFYDLLKPLASIDNIGEDDLRDWGQESAYVQEIGVGECAGVMTDMVGLIIGEAKNKIALARLAMANNGEKDAIYHAYNTFIIGAKALLLANDIACNTQIKILEDFQTNFVEKGDFSIEGGDFVTYVLRLKESLPSRDFVSGYLRDAENFLQDVIEKRSKVFQDDKEVIGSYYKA